MSSAFHFLYPLNHYKGLLHNSFTLDIMYNQIYSHFTILVKGVSLYLMTDLCSMIFQIQYYQIYIIQMCSWMNETSIFTWSMCDVISQWTIVQIGCFPVGEPYDFSKEGAGAANELLLCGEQMGVFNLSLCGPSTPGSLWLGCFMVMVSAKMEIKWRKWYHVIFHDDFYFSLPSCYYGF